MSEKIANWKVGLNLDRYIRNGYLSQDDKGQLYLDWRTRAEVDQKKLIDMLLSAEKQGSANEADAGSSGLGAED